MNLLNRIRAVLFAFLFSFWGKSVTAQTYFPPVNTNQWDTLSPDRLQFCPDRIDSLYKFLEASNSKAFILLKDGKIVLERYFGRFTQDSVWYWASAGKTLTASLIGIAESKKQLAIGDASSLYLGSGWTSLSKSQEDSISIWHQLTMTSGLDESKNPDCTDPSCLTYTAPVGTRWSYHNAPYTRLDQVIEAASGQKINTFLAQQLSVKTGINGLYVRLGYNNVFFSKARSMARFGWLLLNKGQWSDNQIIPELFVSQMAQTSQNLNPSYGYLTWLNGKSHHMLPGLPFRFNGTLSPPAPDDAYAALGKNGQMLQIIPSKNMVWMRMGESPDDKNPLISVTYADDVWSYINALNCENAAQEGISGKSKIDLYPNPVVRGGYIKFSTFLTSEMDVYDVYGRLWAQVKSGSESLRIPENWPIGCYVAVPKNGQKAQRFVVIP
jgi:CubicO group peptidase (beta-lactamase class C family)